MPDRSVVMRWKGPISKFLQDDTTREHDVEGALSSGKTTGCLWYVRNSTIRYPGIHWFIARYGDGDTQNKLKPAFEAICAESSTSFTWDSHSLCYNFPEGSKVYSFGLKSGDHLARYAKLRGLGVAGIYIDQAEELPKDVFYELRARLRQAGFPQHLIISPNPMEDNDWLSLEFPEDNSIPTRKYWHVSLYDNAHNLPQATIENLERAYPKDHAKYRSVILGRRGLNVIGEPVYKSIFRRDVHVRPVAFNPHLPLLQAFDFGKHHPCVIFGQQPFDGGWNILGGVQGEDLYLDDFLPIVDRYRSEWFADVREIASCCDPAGSHDNSQGSRYNALSILKMHHIIPRFKDNSNAPDVRLGMIERLAGYMRRRGREGEAFAVHPDHWVRVLETGHKKWTFVTDALEAGYVWDTHYVSVGSSQMRRPKKDGVYEHGMNCLEYLELNFGAAMPTRAEQAKRAMREGPRWPRPQGPGAWMS